MALDVSAQNLWDESESAITFREKHTDLSESMIKAFAGPRFRTDWTPDSEQHENHAFEWVTNMVPNLVFTNPQVEIKSDELEPEHPVLKATEAGLNAWIRAVNLADVLDEVAVDLQFDFGVLLITLESVPSPDGSAYQFSDMPSALMPQPPYLRPRCYRLSPRRFFMDPQATSRRHPRYMGHDSIEDKQALIDAKKLDGEARYDEAAIKSLAADDMVDDALNKLGQHPGTHRVTRNQIVVREIYVPETGMIYTLAASGPTAGSDTKPEAKFIRKPRPYVGPVTGPYVLFGLHIIPDQLYPLPPLAPVNDLMEEINAHSGQASEDAGAAKKLIVTDGDPKLTKAITSEASGTVVSIPQFSGRAQAVEIGGVSQGTMDYIQFLRDRLDRISGITDAVSGNITGATAEEIHTAQANRNVRIRKAQSRFRSCVVDALRVVLFHLWHNPRVVFPVQITDEKTGQAFVGEFRGGPGPDGDPLSYEALRVEIEPYSMEAVDQAVLQMRMEKAVVQVMGSAQNMVMQPWIRWRQLVDDQFEVLNIKGGGGRYINWDMLTMAQQMSNPMLFGLVPPMLGAPVGGGGGMGGPPGGGGGGPVEAPTDAVMSRNQTSAANRVA
jgi:hypothetical protein